MIAAVKGWSAVLSALLFFIPAAARAADDLGSAASELARKTATFLGRNETLALGWRNASSLSSPEQSAARAAFETALRDSGVRPGEASSAAEARITFSENQTHYLMVEELRKGEERQVWIAGWKRSAPAVPPTAGVTVEKKLMWEQEEPMLDVAFPPGGVLGLGRSGVTLFAESNGHWQPKSTAPVNLVKTWPRDPRGRLRLHGTAIQVHLPGGLCTGYLEPVLTLACRASDEPWVLESGSRAMLLAGFMAARNYFDGRVTTQAGQPKSVAPFYAAASVEAQGRPLWLLAQVDGMVQIYDSGFEPAGTVAGWGSDIAGVDAPCAGGSAVLATRPGDAAVTDAVQAFSFMNGTAVPLGQASELPGPVLALWPAGGAAAVAIVRNQVTGNYEAYLLTVVCA
jgi:hypothetical protein